MVRQITRDKTKQQIDYDKILDHTGHFGRYQMVTTAILCMSVAPPGMHAVASVFEAAVPEFSCHSENGTTVSVIGSSTNEAACRMYHVGDVIGNSTNSDDAINLKENASALTCKAFDYDRSVFESTIVTEVSD